MSQINFQLFAKIIKYIYVKVSNGSDIAIEIENDLYSKKNTLNILKEFDINPLKVKKIVSLNQDGKWVIDNGLSTNDIFISNESLSQDDQNLFKKDQLIFVEDETDNNKINVYKILFDESEGEVRPELGLCESIDLSLFNSMFLYSGLFIGYDILINQKIEGLLEAPIFQNPFQEPAPVWEREHFRINGYYLNSTLIIDFKKHLALVNVEKDYFIYRKENEIIIENVSDGSDRFVIPATPANITDNDVFYLKKNIDENGEILWETYKITSTLILGSFHHNLKYQAYEYNVLTEQQFNDLKALSIPSQLGFTVDPGNNNGLVSFFKEEQREIDLVAMGFLINAPEVLPEDLPDLLPIVNNISETLQNNSVERLYSLVIEDNKIKITEISSSSSNEEEELISEQELSQDNKKKWNDIEVAGKYQKVYFAKNPNNNLVEKWVVIADQNQLQCIGTISLPELRKSFANNNLFPITLNGIHCGENGAQVKVAKAAAEQVIPPEPLVTKLSPAIVNNVINLKWDDSRELWDLNITTSKETLDKKIKLEKDENDILKNLIDKNNNANTVILFNKCDGKFLRAYYFDENNKKVNCSNKLSDEDKEQLSVINQKAKARVLEARIVTPISSKSGLFSKNNNTFNLSIINRKCYVLCNDEFEISLRAEVDLRPEEISALSYLVKNAVDFSLTFDKNNNFKSISYKNHVNQSNVTIDMKDLPDSNTFNQKNIKTDELMETIIEALEDSKKLKPEDDWVTPKPWNSDIAAKVNGTSSPSSTTQQPPQQQQM
ncbi:hypothetical protein [Spiroplasma endosymbiont of Notiophilus biguttatus]|uniref:hypothetical protein n=1 Tax=Spiroplasma endosymbiont of Notiophilus biguttatus TaxID=3066285 RepID=UPI00313BB0D3